MYVVTELFKTRNIFLDILLKNNQLIQSSTSTLEDLYVVTIFVSDLRFRVHLRILCVVTELFKTKNIFLDILLKSNQLIHVMLFYKV